MKPATPNRGTPQALAVGGCQDGLDGDGARFPSALIGLNVELPKGIKGIVLKPLLEG